MGEQIDGYDIRRTDREDVKRLLPRRARRRADPGRVFAGQALREALDDDRANGCIRDMEHAYSKEGGLAVLYGNSR